MKRTALIAAVLSIIPLTAGAVTADAQSFYRDGGMHRDGGMYRPGGFARPAGPPVVYHGYGGYRRDFDHPRRHHWRPMPPWRRWHDWR